MSPTVPVPRLLNLAAVLNGLLGCVYLVVALLAHAEGAIAPIYVFFGGAGLAMLIGSIGVLTRRRWALEIARIGLLAILTTNAVAAVALVWGLIIGAPGAPAGAWLAAVVMSTFTALLFWLYRQLRGQQTHDFLWAHEEISIQDSPHEIVQDVVFDPTREQEREQAQVVERWR